MGEPRRPITTSDGAAIPLAAAVAVDEILHEVRNRLHQVAAIVRDTLARTVEIGVDGGLGPGLDATHLVLLAHPCTVRSRPAPRRQ